MARVERPAGEEASVTFELRVRDVSRRGARRLALRLPDGRRLRVEECPGGWRVRTPRRRGSAPCPRLADALAPHAGADSTWVARVEEFATRLGSESTPESAAADSDLAAALDARLGAFCARHPGAYAEGPRAQHGGGWYVFIGGLPGEAWIVEYAERPEAAAAAALARAEVLSGG